MCSCGFLFYVDSKGDVLQNALIKARDGRSLPDRLNFSGLCLSFIICHCAQLGAQIVMGPSGAAAKQFSSVRT